MDVNKPLVSVMIPNYNYGEYLANCFESLLNQTYTNIDVYFRDNDSTDRSFEIAMSYFDKFREKGIPFMIANNRRNVGSSKNTQLLLREREGKYEYVLASDDYIAPTFIETCVKIFEEHPTVSMVMTHRKEVDENGNVKESLPFYNQNCIIPAEEQLGVFMMAGIVIPGQRMGNPALTRPIQNFFKVHNVAGDWYDNYLYACCGDIAYVKEPLCYYRVHSGNETSVSEDRLVGTFEHFLLLDSFVHIADAFGFSKPQKRYDEAVRKLGSMCLRYALKMYQNNKAAIARRYLLLALVYDESLKEREEYRLLFELQDAQGEAFEQKLKAYESRFCLERTKSYDPPEGAMPLDI